MRLSLSASIASRVEWKSHDFRVVVEAMSVNQLSCCSASQRLDWQVLLMTTN